MAKPRVRLELDQLGDRVLPSSTSVPIPMPNYIPFTPIPTQFTYGSAQVTATSASGAVYAAGPGPIAPPAAPASQLHALAGSVLGSFKATTPHAGGATTYQLKGTAWLAGLGSVTVTGVFRTVGSESNGQASGTITFRNAKGSVSIGVLGTQQHSLSPPPQWFTYSAFGGTGAYKNLKDSGTLWLGISNSGAVKPATHGTFYLNLL